MGLFSKKSPEEKQQWEEKYTAFCGNSLQPIGKIPMKGFCKLSLKPEERILNIRHEKIDISLPYDRIKSFSVEDETTLAKSGSGLGGAIVGGALFGGVGAIVGQNSKKGKTKVKWIATLTYEDKEGNIQELYFVETGVTGLYDGNKKSLVASKFEKVINKICSDNSEDITEL